MTSYVPKQIPASYQMAALIFCLFSAWAASDFGYQKTGATLVGLTIIAATLASGVMAIALYFFSKTAREEMSQGENPKNIPFKEFFALMMCLPFTYMMTQLFITVASFVIYERKPALEEMVTRFGLGTFFVLLCAAAYPLYLASALIFHRAPIVASPATAPHRSTYAGASSGGGYSQSSWHDSDGGDGGDGGGD